MLPLTRAVGRLTEDYVQDTRNFHRTNRSSFDRHFGNACRWNWIVSLRERSGVCISRTAVEILICLISSPHCVGRWFSLAQCDSRAAFHPFLSSKKTQRPITFSASFDRSSFGCLRLAGFVDFYWESFCNISSRFLGSVFFLHKIGFSFCRRFWLVSVL